MPKYLMFSIDILLPKPTIKMEWVVDAEDQLTTHPMYNASNGWFPNIKDAFTWALWAVAPERVDSIREYFLAWKSQNL